ncbi:MAG: AzlD domain-containing protein [Deltaproteobacteria bacterium]|jgi:branched-subunit amino acid transport protein|nr:AzlD domain-containing protein [Deltaproteobacteria bacterium]
MIEPAYFWTVVALLALGTLAIRGSIIAISSAGKFVISDRMRELFSFIPAAIIPAIVAPMVFFHSGKVEWLGHRERLWVLLLAIFVCYFTRHMVATVGFGLFALYLVTQIG